MIYLLPAGLDAVFSLILASSLSSRAPSEFEKQAFPICERLKTSNNFNEIELSQIFHIEVSTKAVD